MTKPTKTLIGFALVSTLALTACSSDIGAQRSRSSVSNSIDAVDAQIGEDGSRLQKLTATGRPSNIRVRDGLYLGREGFRTGRGDPLPRRFEADDGVAMNVAREMNLAEFTTELRRMTGLRIDIRDVMVTPMIDGTMLGRAGGTTAATGGSTADSTGMGSPVAGQDNGGGEGGGDSSDHPIDVNFRVNYTGPLSGLLDYVAAQVGADWEYRGGRIKFLGEQTVTYTVWALPGITSSDSTVGGGNAEVFGGASPATTKRQFQMDYWSDIQAGLDAIIPEAGARYSLNKSNGTIVVTAFQNIHERVATYIEHENARLSRQVAIKLDILAFSSTDSDNRASNLQLSLNEIAAGLGGTINSAPNLVDDGLSLGATVIDTDTGGSTNMNTSGYQETLNGSSAIISALSKRGKVSVLKSISVMATNNSPTPISIMEEKAYLAGTTTTISDEEEVTEMETGVVNNGINVVVTPRILSSGEVNLDYTMNLSQLIGMEQFVQEGSTIQLPEVETRNLMQNINMGSGDTMVIASYDSRRNARDASGPFDPRFWGLGGQDGFSAENTKIIVMMTPVVVEKQNAPRIRN